MSAHRPYIPNGIYQQGRITPTRESVIEQASEVHAQAAADTGLHLLFGTLAFALAGIAALIVEACHL